MTPGETRLREALQHYGAAPAGRVDFDVLVQRRRRHRRTTWAGVATSAAAIAVLLTWFAAGSSPSAGNATLVPAASPSAPADVPVNVVIPPGQRQVAPPLTGTTLAGKPFDLYEDRNKVTVVSFGGSGCAPCRSQQLALKAITPAYGQHGPPVSQVSFVGVDERDGLSNARSYYLNQLAVSYPVVFDADGKLGPAWNPGEAVPVTVILDREGRIAARLIGEVGGSRLHDIIARLQAEPESSEACGGGSVPPGLVAAIGTDGTCGYVKASELFPSTDPTGPQEALKQRKGATSKTIPLYAKDGTTVIGRFFMPAPGAGTG